MLGVFQVLDRLSYGERANNSAACNACLQEEPGKLSARSMGLVRGPATLRWKRSSWPFKSGGYA
eukprot:29013-Eustigmatos_ZCMA.PRE.1